MIDRGSQSYRDVLRPSAGERQSGEPLSPLPQACHPPSACTLDMEGPGLNSSSSNHGKGICNSNTGDFLKNLASTSYVAGTDLHPLRALTSLILTNPPEPCTILTFSIRNGAQGDATTCPGSHNGGGDCFYLTAGDTEGQTVNKQPSWDSRFCAFSTPS